MLSVIRASNKKHARVVYSQQYTAIKLERSDIECYLIIEHDTTESEHAFVLMASKLFIVWLEPYSW